MNLPPSLAAKAAGLWPEGQESLAPIRVEIVAASHDFGAGIGQSAERVADRVGRVLEV